MRYSRKQKKKLKVRVKDYEAMVKKPTVEAKAYRRPGSNK